MNLTDLLRTLFRIRKKRRLPPASSQPPLGASIVRDRLKISLKVPIDGDEWRFLASKGWRAIDVRKDRRQYHLVPEKFLLRLHKATSDEERVLLHERMLSQMPHKPVGASPARTNGNAK